MRHRLSLLAAAFAALSIATPALAAPCAEQSLGGDKNWKDHRVIDIPPMSEADTDWTRKRFVDLGDGKRTVATYAHSHFGNGTIRIKNLELRTWRGHKGEGFIYRPFALAVELSAKPGSRVCTLTVSGGIALLDQDDDKVVARRPLRLVYEYDAGRDAFRRVAARTPIPLDKIELSPVK